MINNVRDCSPESQSHLTTLLTSSLIVRGGFLQNSQILFPAKEQGLRTNSVERAETGGPGLLLIIILYKLLFHN